MLKSRIRLDLMIGLLILGIVLAVILLRDRQPAQIFPATVNRDCAPWDGSAFTVQIPLKGGNILDVSIWKSPDIKFSKTFSFPDDTGQVGNAILIHPVGLPESMTGDVWFEGVSEGQIVEGGFRLVGERGESFEGRFVAKWESQIALCG